MADRVEALLVRKAIDTLGFARRAGRLVTGFEKTAAALRAGQGVMVLAARDGAADGRRKIGALARHCPLAGALTADELGRAVGRDHVVHAALTRAPGGRPDGRPDGLAESLSVALGRLNGFRAISDGDLENATIRKLTWRSKNWIRVCVVVVAAAVAVVAVMVVDGLVL